MSGLNSNDLVLGAHHTHSPGVTQCFLGVEAQNQPLAELLHATDFSGLSHAYGPATDAVDELAKLSGDSADRHAAMLYLNGAILHQSTPWTVTATVVEVLLRALEDPALREQVSMIFEFVADVADAPSDSGVPLDEDLSSILVADGVDRRGSLFALTRSGAFADGYFDDFLEVCVAGGFEEIFAHARSWWMMVDRFLATHGEGNEVSLPPFAIGAAGYALSRLATLCDDSEREASATRLKWLLNRTQGSASVDRPILVCALGTIESPAVYLDDAERLSRIAAALSPLLTNDDRALSLLAAELGQAVELEVLLDRPEYRAAYLNLNNMIARLILGDVSPEVLTTAGIGCLQWTRSTGTGLFQSARFLPRLFPSRANESEMRWLSPEQCRYLEALLAEGDLFEQFTSTHMADQFAGTGLPGTRRGCTKLIRRSRRANRA